MLVFIDETWPDRLNTIQKYGYSICGKTPRRYELLVRGELVSAVACIPCEGLLDV